MSLKQIVKRVAIGIGSLIAVLLIVSLFLPSKITVQRQIIIEAPAEKIFPLVNRPRNSIKWSPWLSIDPDVKLSFEGPEEGVGARMIWRSDHPKVGNGSQEIIISEGVNRVRVALQFEGQGEAEAYFWIAADVSGSALIWGFESDAGWNPVARYMGLMFDRWLGPFYVRGLNNIKKIAEGDD